MFWSTEKTFVYKGICEQAWYYYWHLFEPLNGMSMQHSIIQRTTRLFVIFPFLFIVL